MSDVITSSDRTDIELDTESMLDHDVTNKKKEKRKKDKALEEIDIFLNAASGLHPMVSAAPEDVMHACEVGLRFGNGPLIAFGGYVKHFESSNQDYFIQTQTTLAEAMKIYAAMTNHSIKEIITLRSFTIMPSESEDEEGTDMVGLLMMPFGEVINHVTNIHFSLDSKSGPDVMLISIKCLTVTQSRKV